MLSRRLVTSFTDSGGFPSDAQIRLIARLEMALGIRESYYSPKFTGCQAGRYIARLISLNQRRRGVNSW